MTQVEWRYFRLEGKYLDMSKRWHDERTRIRTAVADWVEKTFGTNEVFGTLKQSEYRISGIKDVGQDRLGWKTESQHPGYLFPDTRKNQSKAQRDAGKAWQQKLDEFTHGGPTELRRAIGAETWMMPAGIPGRGSCLMVEACIEAIDGNWFVAIPKGVDWKPPADLPEIKEWEVLKLRDERDAKEQAKAVEGEMK